LSTKSPGVWVRDVLDAPSTVQCSSANGPAGVWQTSARLRSTSTPSATTIRRIPAFVQLPGPQGCTVRSWLIASTIVAAPNPSNVPVPVLISWKMPRSAMRLVTPAFVSLNVASRRLA
jgi:hypothetical protein